MTKPLLTFKDRTRNTYLLKSKIGSGGEGDVYDLEGGESEHYVAKIYKEAVTEEKREKLTVMVHAFDETLAKTSAWPKELLLDNRNNVRGFIMPRVTGYKAIHELYNPSARKKHFPEADWSFLVNSARNVVAAFHAIHSRGFVIGDVNEGNLLVSNASIVKLIDCDSFQISNGQRIYPCEVGVPMYTPPELQHLKSFRDKQRTINHDFFGLAVICFQLLFMGRHPFVGIYGGADIPLEKAIEGFRFAYGPLGIAKGISPPSEALDYDCIPTRLRLTFEKSFSELGATQRPDTSQFIEELNNLRSRLKGCGHEPKHKFFEGVSECPWCKLENSKGTFFFLSSKISAFTLKGFNLHEVWNKLMTIQLPSEPNFEIANTQINGKSWPLQYYFFRILSVGQRISAFFVPVWLIALFPTWFLLAIPLGVLIYNLKLFHSPIQKEIEKRKHSLEYSKKKWEEIKNRWNREAGSYFFEGKWKELAAAKHKYENLGTDYNKEMQVLHSRKHELQLQKFLSGYFIRNHAIQGIGETRKSTLSSFGIDTAADVVKLKRIKIPGFGTFLEGQLFDWRTLLSKRFKFDSSKGIDTEEINQINKKFENMKLNLQNQLIGGVEGLMNIKNHILRNRVALKNGMETASREFQQATKDWERML